MGQHSAACKVNIIYLVLKALLCAVQCRTPLMYKLPRNLRSARLRFSYFSTNLAHSLLLLWNRQLETVIGTSQNLLLHRIQTDIFYYLRDYFRGHFIGIKLRSYKIQQFINIQRKDVGFGYVQFVAFCITTM